MSQESIFLTTEQAIKAICIDFRQYEPQIMLFCSIISLISDDTVHFKREPGKEGIWINQSGRPHMRWLDRYESIEFMCAAVENTRWTPELLASVCSRVFQSRARPETDRKSGQTGIRIETDLASFACRQCGQCCRRLDYHQDVTAEDVTRWRTLGREDILQWVAVNSRDGQMAAYRVWVMPGTQQQTETCPFLKIDHATNRWGCRIHAVKPDICRNYPVNRKHALMTGCPGFKKQVLKTK